MSWFKNSIIAKSLEGPNGGVSSTRINVYALLLVLIAACILNLVTGKILADVLLDNLMIALLGFAGLKTIDGGLKNNRDIQINKAVNGKPEINVTKIESADVTQVGVDGTEIKQTH